VIEAAKAGRISLTVSFRALGRPADALCKKMVELFEITATCTAFFATGEGNLLADYLRI